MTRSDLLEAFKVYTEDVTKNLIMPVRVQSKEEKQTYRAAEVYKMRLPDGTSAKKKAPYIIHQIMTGSDVQKEGVRTERKATVRTIFCVYSDNEQEGGLMLLNLMERLTIHLLKDRLLSKQFRLDMESGIETLCYPDDTAPYYGGEMITTWYLPPVSPEYPLRR